MATLVKRGRLQFQIRIRKRGIKISRTFSSKSDAKKWAAAIERKIDSGTYIHHPKILLEVKSESAKRQGAGIEQAPLLGDVIEKYKQVMSAQKKGKEIEAYRLGAFMKDPVGKLLCAMPITEIMPAHIRQYRDERLKVVCGSTVNRDFNLLGHLFEMARIEWDIKIPENPVRAVRRPKHNRGRQRRLVGDEEVRLMHACRTARNPFLEIIVTLAIETAMRRGEIIGLAWEHINFINRTVYLPDTKNGDPRSVPLSKKATEVLKKLPRSAIGNIFPGLSQEALKRSFQRATKRAGIEDLHFHDLRHEAVSRLFEKGTLDLMEIATISGHKSLSMLKRYTHLHACKLIAKID